MSKESIRMRKLLSFVLVFILCVSLVACGGGKKNLIDDTELVSNLRLKISEKANSDLRGKILGVFLEYGKSFSSMEPVMKSIEKEENGNYCVIGELRIDLQDNQTGGLIHEYLPFTAFLSENNGEFSCDSLEFEIGKDSLFSD